MEESHPEEPLIHSITPQHIFISVGTFAFLLFCLLFGLFFFTPIGTLLLGKESLNMVENIQRLNERVEALRDSVDDRDRQLRSIKQVIVRGRDTTFQINSALVNAGTSPETTQEDTEQPDAPRTAESSQPAQDRTMSFEIDEPTEEFPAPEAIIEMEDDLFGSQGANLFPAEPPVRGSFSRDFSTEKGHFGLDITARDGSPVHAIAAGIVILAEWTFNYGYVIYVQHPGGWISGFKHCTSLSRKAGDVVNARDIIGTVGNSGLISSGPHLHVELWQNGVPVDPAKFLIK